MSLHSWHSQGSCDPSSCTTLTLNLHWGRAATGKKKKKKNVLHAGLLWSCPTLRPCGLWPARLLHQGDFPGKSTGVDFPTLLERYISCCPKPPTPLNIWCCQGTCDPSSCSTSTPGTHWGQGPAKSPEQPQDQTQWMTYMQRWK